MSKVLVLNLGGTSTKIAIFEDETMLVEKNIHHPREISQMYKLATEQIVYRKNVVQDWLEEHGYPMSAMAAVAVRGGSLAHTKKGGTYLVNETAIKEREVKIKEIPSFYHGTQIVIPLAVELIGDLDIPIYLTDPPSVNEMIPEAKIAGHPSFERIPILHVLNAKAVGRHLLKELGYEYEKSRLVICHMGAGVSVSAHLNGQIIDANNCFAGEGPMSANRVGQLQIGQLVERCFSGEITHAEMMNLIRSDGGVKGHLGTADMRKVEQLVEEGDEKAELISKAFILQIAKGIGEYCATLDGDVDFIILTGGIAHSKLITKGIMNKVHRFAPVLVYGGELESQGLAYGALPGLNGDISVMDYSNPEINEVDQTDPVKS